MSVRGEAFTFFFSFFLSFSFPILDTVSCVWDSFALLLYNPSHHHWAWKLKDLVVFQGALWEAQGVIRQQEQSCNNKNTAIAG